jgi:hypothetical protein
MRTQLIPLESHDDLISVRDRMSWAKTPRILLIWPKSEHISLRPLDLKVLQRHAASLGAQLGLVVRHRNIRREAQALEIPVFNSTGEAQRVHWPEHNLHRKREQRKPSKDLKRLREQVRAREGAWRSHPAVRIGAFLFGVLAVLTIASLFIPRAQVILAPETEVQTVTLPVQADSSLDTVFISGRIPSRELRVIVEGGREIDGTGQMPVPQTKAEGVVTFRNLTEGELTIPAGTVLTSTGLPGVRFLTMEEGELSGGLEATVDVPVQAESPGAVGNVEAETILAIEGDLGLLVTVINEEATSGGSNRLEIATNERDLSRLRNKLLEELDVQALAEMEGMLTRDDQLFLDTMQSDEILEETYDPPLSQPSRRVTLTLRIEYTAAYASGEDLTELATTVLDASLPEGFIPTENTLDFETLGTYSSDDNGITRWDMRVSRKLEKQMDSGQIISLIQGRSPAVATAQLENNLDLMEAPKVQLTPEWWPWLPLIPFNITVETG